MTVFSAMARKYSDSYKSLVNKLSSKSMMLNIEAKMKDSVKTKMAEMLMKQKTSMTSLDSLTQSNSVSSLSNSEMDVKQPGPVDEPIVIWDRRKKKKEVVKTPEQIEKERLIEFTNDYLKIELKKIHLNRKPMIMKGAQADVNAQFRNQSFSELYKHMVVQDNYKSVVKRGENKLIFASSGSQNDKIGEEVNKEEIFMRHFKEALKGGQLPNIVIFTEIENHCLNLQGYNLSKQAYAISKAISLNNNKL